MLLEHNNETFIRMEEMLSKYNRAMIVATTGIGKSYVALEYLERHNHKALVICPKLAICNAWKALTDRVDTITYHSFAKTYSIYADADYSCYIFDEAHHTGGKVWNKSVREFMDTHSEPIIGLTADSKRYSDGGRDMAYELWDGHVVYGHNLQEAIEQKILPSISYICTVFDLDSKIKEYEKKNVSDRLVARLKYSQENYCKISAVLKRHMPDTKRKGIVFADSIKAIPNAIKVIKETYPDAIVRSIHSGKSNEENKEILAEFDGLDEGYLVTVDMVNEGLHLSNVNTIIMLRRTSSPSLYFQQIGRSMSTNNKEVMVFDFVGNHCSLQTVAVRLESMKVLMNNQDRKHSEQIIVADYASDIIQILNEISDELKHLWTEEEDNILRQYYLVEGSKVAERLENRTPGACCSRAKELGLKIVSFWTDDEIRILKENYEAMGSEIVSLLPDRTWGSILTKARELDLSCKKYWTEEEDAILKKYFATEGKDRVAERLPERTPAACFNRAKLLGIPFKTKDNYWSEEEDEILRKFYPTEGRKVAKRLNNRTEGCCSTRASIMGIKCAVSGAWSDAEDDILKAYYASEGKSIMDRLPGRSYGSITQRAKKLGIAIQTKWSKEEDSILISFYPSEGADASKRLKNRSETAVKQRAAKLGLKYEKPVNMSSWTPEEINIIKEYYLEEKSDIIKRFPNKSLSTIRNKAREIGLTKQPQPWTSEEDAILKAYYPTEGYEVSKRLLNRSKSSIKERVSALNITRNNILWTEEEDMIVMENYPRMGVKTLKLLPNRSRAGLIARAKKLGLTKQ